jgi:hypothetical protein
MGIASCELAARELASRPFRRETAFRLKQEEGHPSHAGIVGETPLIPNLE